MAPSTAPASVVPLNPILPLRLGKLREIYTVIQSVFIVITIRAVSFPLGDLSSDS